MFIWDFMINAMLWSLHQKLFSSQKTYQHYALITRSDNSQLESSPRKRERLHVNSCTHSVASTVQFHFPTGSFKLWPLTTYTKCSIKHSLLAGFLSSYVIAAMCCITVLYVIQCVRPVWWQISLLWKSLASSWLFFPSLKICFHVMFTRFFLYMRDCVKGVKNWTK